MKKNLAREKLKRGEAAVGTWLVLPNVMSTQLMARVGFDWLTVELEHSPTNWETAAQMFGAIASAGGVPLCRVPWNTGENIKRALDNGAWGVIVPMVNSRAEAEAVVAAARYQPIGRRTIGGQLSAANFETDQATYYARANDEILVVVMIEHVDGVERADEILRVPGIDVVFIGPNDLHNSMGRAPAFESEDPRFNQALERVLKAARKYGVAPGIHVADVDAAQRRRDQGFQFIAVKSEAGMMLAKAAEAVKVLGLGQGRTVAKY
jgi:4-hydroxy-2-oxoheptanedioate aldolase